MVDQALLLLRIAVLVLLFVFIWRITRLAIADVRGSAESMILRPGKGGAPVIAPTPVAAGRLRVTESEVLPVGAAVVLDQPEILLGRDPSAAAGFVSARHAIIRMRGGTPMIADLGSTNGTYVNGEQIASETTLRPGDTVAIGSTRMVYETERRR
jgi:hypothetical protein